MLRISTSRASLLISFALAASLSANPSLADQSDRRQQLSDWFAQLANRQPDIRFSAQQHLMAMSADELPMFRDVVASAPHLSVAQVDPLEEIVLYVFTRGQLQQQQASVSQPFLGLSEPLSAYEQEDEADNVVQVGVPIGEPLYGFVGYRCLREGDVILSIGSAKRVTPTPTWQDLLDSIKPLHPGDEVTIQVLRSNRLVTVTFPLDARPEAAGDRTTTDDLATQRLNGVIEGARGDAQTYYDTQFRPLTGAHA